jgi:hypothetical protein
MDDRGGVRWFDITERETPEFGGAAFGADARQEVHEWKP